MDKSLFETALKIAELLNQPTPRLGDEELNKLVKQFLDNRDIYLETSQNEGSPLYLIDTEALKLKADKFKKAFSEVIPDIKIFYALKSNSHPLIAKTLIGRGLGLDVSSGLELEQALEYDPSEIIFSGTGKQNYELQLAVENYDRVTVLLDSLDELEKLEQLAAEKKVNINAGVRLTTDERGIWKKFGISLEKLDQFSIRASNCKWVNLCGLQFHLSWNLNPEQHILFITRLGSKLKQLTKNHRDKIRFLDIGGGYWPEEGEWLQFAATTQGIFPADLLNKPVNLLEHYKKPAAPITTFADHIAEVLKKQLPRGMQYTVYTEPGRWICNNAMHILLTVIDRKSPEVVITDGGTNAVGWERFESDYFPVINLSNPSLVEHECLIAGSLCTPHDIWGSSYFGKDIDVGDVLLVPNQGAYTYSLRQEFIKPLPKAVEIIKTNNEKVTLGMEGINPASSLKK